MPWIASLAFVSVLTLTVSLARPAAATENDSPALAPLFDGLGSYHHPITTSVPKAQRYFDQGLTLLYGFNHKEAIRSFEAATRLDPECALAWWGIAYAFGPHVNKPMSAEDNTNAWQALQQALRRAEKVTVQEQAYLRALARRYEAEPRADRSALDKAYAAAMREVVQEYPDDLDAQTLLAEALMDTMPWDYWLKDRSPKPETEEAIAALRYVIARNPDHPGANHFYIHAVEAGPQPELGLPAADRLGRFAPQAGHLVHMPSHIYMRVGQYHDAVLSNERAVQADRSYLQQCRAQGYYPGVYYPHNLHFLWHALTFEGRTEEALRVAERVAGYARDNYCGPSKVVEAPRLRHLPWLTQARFGQWDEVLKVSQPPETNDFLVDRVMWHFVRGLAFAARHDAEQAAREHAHVARLGRSEAATRLNNPQYPATGTLEVAVELLAAKVAAARRQPAEAVQHFEKAIAAEGALPYMEPAYWPFPTRPALGAALLEAGEAVKAETVFREDLRRWPRNAWGLLGLEQSLRRQKRDQLADIVRSQFAEAWKHADVKLKLEWF